jgi:ribosomal protein L32
MPNSTKGFASMPAAKKRAAQSKGGKSAQASGRANRFTSESAAAAGRKGAQSRRRMITAVRCPKCGEMFTNFKLREHPCL